MIRTLSLLATVGLLLGSTQVVHAELPNIVWVMADDLGYGDVKCFGGERCQIETPHFDRLAREGMRFTDAHPVASVCVPSRIAIMTGRYPWRFQSPIPSGEWGFLNPQFATEQLTLGKLLKRAGYHTGYVGKWHLGTLMATTDGQNQGIENVDYTRPLEIGPADYGFDESFILPGSLDMYPYAFVRNNRWVGEVSARKGWSAFNRVGPAAVDFEDDRVLDTFSREAETFIEAAAADRARPFFLYLALTSPHTPISPREEFQGRSRIGPYGDFVMETDDCLGRVLAVLDRLQLADRTLVIATSDHGPASYAGPNLKATPGQVHQLEQLGHYPAGPYRGYKFSAYEGGLRVPFIARWPGVVAANSSCDRLVGLQDAMATIAEMVDQPLEANEGPDSLSFLRLLKDPQSEPLRRSLIMRSTLSFVVRQDEWKLLLCPGSGCSGVYGNEPAAKDAWAAALEQFGREPKGRELMQAPFIQLYRLTDDPGETRNLAAEDPERVAELEAVLVKAIERGRSTPGPALRNDRQPPSVLPRVVR